MQGQYVLREARQRPVGAVALDRRVNHLNTPWGEESGEQVRVCALLLVWTEGGRIAQRGDPVGLTRFFACHLRSSKAQPVDANAAILEPGLQRVPRVGVVDDVAARLLARAQATREVVQPDTSFDASQDD
jgi:hypothetical protein